MSRTDSKRTLDSKSRALGLKAARLAKYRVTVLDTDALMAELQSTVIR